MSLALKIISSIVIKCCLCNNKKNEFEKVKGKKQNSIFKIYYIISNKKC